MLPHKIRQRIDRSIDVEQGGICVEVGGQFDPAMPHGSLGDNTLFMYTYKPVAEHVHRDHVLVVRRYGHISQSPAC